MRKKLMAAVVFLFVITAVLAVMHKGSQKEESGLVITGGGKEILIEASALDQGTFSGELVDGKGDVTAHEYRGVLLKQLLEEQGFSVSERVTITSADHYSVDFSKEEVYANDRLYLAVEADGKVLKNIDDQDGGIQAIIFGDPNSKRCVRFTAQVEVR